MRPEVMEFWKAIALPIALIIIAIVLIIYYRLIKRTLNISDVELPWLKIKKREPSQPVLEEITGKIEELKPKTEREKVEEENVEALELQVIRALGSDKAEEEAERVFNKILEKSKDEEERCLNECWKNYMYHLFKKRNVFSSLDDLSRKYPSYRYPHSYKGNIYKRLKEYKKAISCYEKARDICKNAKDKLSMEIKISETKRLNFDYEGLEDKLNNLLSQYEEDKQRSYIYEELGYLYLEKDKDKEKAISCFEKALELDSDNIDIRFTIAYQYSELDNDKKSLFYYKTYCDNKDDATALNNLGVACEKLGMPIKAVYYYKKSMEKKESLAMANLANKYIGKGFIEEAKKLLDEGLKCYKPHPNIAEAISRIQLLEEEEDKKEKEIIDSVIKSKSQKTSKH